jgi:hypothetical protein
MAESTEKKTVVERASNVTDEVLERLEARQLAAIGAVRTLVGRLNEAVPGLVDDPALRKKVIDAIGDYYEQLVTTTNEFVRRVVRGESRVVPKPSEVKDEVKDFYGFVRSFVRGGRETGEQESKATQSSSAD